MKRRTVLGLVGGFALGSTAIVATSAVTRVESQRQVTVAVSSDPTAYVGMDECPEPDSNDDGPHVDVRIDEKGHLEIEITDVEASRKNEFPSVFQVCNFGKDDAGVWIEAEDNPELDNGDRVQFFLADDPDNRVDSGANAVVLPVGECTCIGILADARGLEDVQLLKGDEVVVHADVGLAE